MGTLSGISRREFLKLSSAGLLALLAARFDTGIYAHADRTNNGILNLGRITANKVDHVPITQPGF